MPHASRREPVDVQGARNQIAAISKTRAQIVDHDEQHTRLRFLTGGAAEQQRNHRYRDRPAKSPK